jgi:hypothetical protein
MERVGIRLITDIIVWLRLTCLRVDYEERSEAGMIYHDINSNIFEKKISAKIFLAQIRVLSSKDQYEY